MRVHFIAYWMLLFLSFKVYGMSTLQVSIAPSMPHDPAKIQSMADYDLALCLYRTWFEYDQSRQAKPGIITSWKFDNKAGAYVFVIDKNIRWSDGSALTPEQLIKNLDRMIKKKSSYGASIDAIVNLNDSKIIDQNTFILPTKNKKPSTAFFQRMGSIFLAVTHPKDWDKNGEIVNNTISLGPYKITEQTSSDIILTANNFDVISNPKRIQKIHIRFPKKPINVNEFIEGNSFENIIQSNTLMTNETFEKILKLKLPYWTRAYDRVSLLVPIKTYSKNTEGMRHFIRLFGKMLHEQREMIDIPKNVKIAQSLQPKGYPLNEIIKYNLENAQSKDLPKTISILVVDGDQFRIHEKLFEDVIKKNNLPVKITWVIKTNVGEIFKEDRELSKYDFKIFSFGVADPESATWLSLVLSKENPFVEVSNKDLSRFENILKKHVDNDLEVLKLRDLITSIGERGSYLPLFHFSTMSIARPGISFENINELDETVDYSKLIIK